MKASVHVQPETGQDRAVALPVAGGLLVAVADGAGGLGDGAAAAEFFTAFMTTLCRSGLPDWFAALCAFDEELSAHPCGGQTTGVVAFIDEESISGASVGDSGACLISPSGMAQDLTASQRRKPLLGSGLARPVAFKARHAGQRILLATDGLLHYAPLDQICALAAQKPPAEAVIEPVNRVRLPSGALCDDVTVVIITP